MAWIAQVAVAAYGAYQSSSAAKKKAKADAAGKNEISYRTPYMNEYISQIAPYILGEAGKMYQSRLGKYDNLGGGGGYKPGDFSPIAARLAGVPINYSGVGIPGKPIMNGDSAAYPTPFNPNSFTASYGKIPEMTQQQMKERRAYINQQSGGNLGGGGGLANKEGMADAGPDNINDLISYWR